MKISVILPCYNGASTIGDQMEALCRQSWPGGWEVIVSNNGSTDDSIAIVEKFRHRLPELKIAEAYAPPGPRLGAFHSYNVGFEVATGDAFVLCEADDVVGDGWLQAMGSALLEHEFVAAKIEYRKLNPEWLLPPICKGLQETEIPRIDCYPYLQFAWGCTFGFRRNVYEKLGKFSNDFNYVFDSEYCFRAQLTGIKIHLVSEAIYHYRLRHTLKGLFRQKVNWGEDFKVLIQCYGAPPGQLIWIRSRINVVKLAASASVLYLAHLIKIPGSRSRLFRAVDSLAWQLGEIKSQSRSLPFEISSTNSIDTSNLVTI